MAWLSLKEKNGIMLTKKCLHIFFSSPDFYLFVFLGIFLNSCLFLGVLYGEYVYYGVHVFDAATLTALWHSNFWDHILHIIVLFAILILSSTITIRYKMATCFMILKTVTQKKTTLFSALILSAYNAKEFFRFALILSLNALINFLSFFDPLTALQYFERELEGEAPKTISKYNRAESLLLLPILIEKLCTLEEAHKISYSLLTQKFGPNFAPNYSFKILIRIVRLITVITTFLIVHFIFNFNVFPTLVLIFFSAFVIESIFKNAYLIFETAVYRYCTEGTSDLFTEHEIKTLFTKE